MVPKHHFIFINAGICFRAVLFRMVPKLSGNIAGRIERFRAVLFRMVPKLVHRTALLLRGFRAVLFRMVPKRNF